MMEPTLLTLVEMSSVVELPQVVLHRLVRIGVIEPVVEEPEPLFAPADALRVRRMARLRRDLGVNYFGARLAIDLLERVADLEQMLAFYERRAPDGDGDGT